MAFRRTEPYNFISLHKQSRFFCSWYTSFLKSEALSDLCPCLYAGFFCPSSCPPCAPCIRHTVQPRTAGFLHRKPDRFECAVHRGDWCALCMGLVPPFTALIPNRALQIGQTFYLQNSQRTPHQSPLLMRSSCRMAQI